MLVLFDVCVGVSSLRFVCLSVVDSAVVVGVCVVVVDYSSDVYVKQVVINWRPHPVVHNVG